MTAFSINAPESGNQQSSLPARAAWPPSNPDLRSMPFPHVHDSWPPQCTGNTLALPKAAAGRGARSHPTSARSSPHTGSAPPWEVSRHCSSLCLTPRQHSGSRLKLICLETPPGPNYLKQHPVALSPRPHITQGHGLKSSKDLLDLFILTRRCFKMF